MIQRKKSLKVLILTHGQTVLRSQWANRMAKFLPEHPFHEIGHSHSHSQADIRIAIPQSIEKIKSLMESVDFLIVDEAHHYYGAKTINDLIKHFKPRYQLLLTGTPRDYIGDKNFNVIGISIGELLPTGQICDPKVIILESNSDLNLEDYDETSLNVKKESVNKLNESQSIIDSLLKTVAPGKTLVICNNQRQALNIHRLLHRKNISSTLSISDFSSGSSDMDAWQKSNDRFLIVVMRGILGLDYPGLMNVIDLSESLNVNRNFQSLCRIVRVNPESSATKNYYKLCSKNMRHITHYVMSFVVALSHPKYYFTYCKESDGTYRVPMRRESLKIMHDFCRDKSIKSLPNLPDVMSFININSLNADEMIRVVSYTTLETVKRLINRTKTGYTDDVALKIIKKYKNRNTVKDNEPTLYRWICYEKKQYLFDEVFGEYVYNVRTLERALKEAKPYKTRMDLKHNNSALYGWFRNSKNMEALDKILPHEFNRWTKESALEKAKLCKTLAEFRTGKYLAAFNYLRRNNFMEDVLRILPGENRKWTEKEALEVCNQFKTRKGCMISKEGKNALKFMERRKLQHKLTWKR